MNKTWVYGAGGFISGYLVKKLKEDDIAQTYLRIESQVKKGQKEERNS